jgi:hypothetical protein
MGWRFCIAGYRFEIAGEVQSLSSIADDWRDFRTCDAPETLIELKLSAPEYRAPGWQPLLPKVTPSGEGGLAIAGDGYEAEVRADRRFAWIKQPPERFPLEAVVRVLLADSLLAREGLLLHSVGLAVGDRASVFVGESGAGKTTLGGLCREAGLACLSDELVGVAPGSGHYTAFGTPWNIGGPARAELSIIGLLAHASAASVDDQPEGELLRAMLPNTLMPDPSPSGRARMFRCACNLIGSVRPVRLRFARHPQVAQVLARAMTGDSADRRARRAIQ